MRNRFTEGQHSHVYGEVQSVTIDNYYHEYGEVDKELVGIMAELERHGLDPKQVMLEALKNLRKCPSYSQRR